MRTSSGDHAQPVVATEQHAPLLQSPSDERTWTSNTVAQHQLDLALEQPAEGCRLQRQWQENGIISRCRVLLSCPHTSTSCQPRRRNLASASKAQLQPPAVLLEQPRRAPEHLKFVALEVELEVLDAGAARPGRRRSVCDLVNGCLVMLLEWICGAPPPRMPL